MVELIFTRRFRKQLSKTNTAQREKVLKQITKLEQQPKAGKPMRYGRKGTRELRVSPFRLSYLLHTDKIVLLNLYHKDEQ